MKYLFKAIWKKYFIILLSIVIITALGFSLLSGLYSGVDSVERSVYKYVSDHNYPDVEFTTELTDKEVIDGLIDESGVKTVQTRLTFVSVIKFGGKTLSVKASSYSDLNDFYIVGQSEDINGDLLVEKKFADNNGIKTGDTVCLKIMDEYRVFTVGKIVSAPEAMISSPVRSMWAETNDFGNVYFSQKILTDITEEKKAAAYKQIADNQKLLDDKKAEAEKTYSDFKDEADIFGLYLLESTLVASSMKTKINTFAENYDSLSQNAKQYISAAIAATDAHFKEKTKELLIPACLAAASLNTDKLFDETSNENALLKGIILSADNAKASLYDDYRYFSDEQTAILADKIRQGQADISSAEYADLKITLNKYGVFGEITDDIILDSYDAAVSITNEIYEFYENAPFDSFSGIYDSVSEYAPDLKAFYGGIRENFSDDAEKITKSFDNEVIAQDIGEIFSEKTEGDLIKSAAAVFFDILSSTDSQLNVALTKKREQAQTAYESALKEFANAQSELTAAKIKVADMKGYESYFNELLIVTEDNIDNKVLYNTVKNKYLFGTEISDGFTFDDSPIKSYISLNIVGIKSLVYIVPSVFYAIVLLVVFLLISLIIKRARKEIGTLRLLGFSTRKIRMFFCLNGLIMAAFGIIVGLFGGYFLSVYICYYYSDFLNIPQVTVIPDFFVFIVAVAATIVTIQIATLSATLQFERITPVEVISNDVYQAAGPSAALTKFASHFKPIVKFNLITLFKGKKKLVLSVICSASVIVVIFTSLAYSASKDRVFDEYFNKRINYDAQVFVTGATDDFIEDLKKLDYVKNPSSIDYYSVTLVSGDKSAETVFCNVLNDDYIKIFDRDGKIIDYPDSGVILEQHIADGLGLKLHDNVVIDGLLFEITALSFQTAGRVNYLSHDAASKLSADYRAVVFDIDAADHQRFSEYASQKDGYIYTMFVDEVKAYNKEIFDSYAMPSIILTIFAVVIGFLIIVNINAYELIDQKRKLCIFKSLGFSFSEISANKFIQSIVQWLFAVIIGLPLGILVSVIVLKFIGSSSREYVYASGIIEFIISLGLTFLYTLISHVVCMHDFRKTDITKEIKDKD